MHRLIRNFMVQMGDPTGTGSGGESAWGKPFADEISQKLHHEGRGILSMANSGPKTNGSQFFITFKSAAHLDGKHSIFGRVVGGLDTLTKLEGALARDMWHRRSLLPGTDTRTVLGSRCQLSLPTRRTAPPSQ